MSEAVTFLPVGKALSISRVAPATLSQSGSAPTASTRTRRDRQNHN
ncbi:MAG: hypothetical protein U0835_00935 [Isosphaeraceae bacterium]